MKIIDAIKLNYAIKKKSNKKRLEREWCKARPRPKRPAHRLTVKIKKKASILTHTLTHWATFMQISNSEKKISFFKVITEQHDAEDECRTQHLVNICAELR